MSMVPPPAWGVPLRVGAVHAPIAKEGGVEGGEPCGEGAGRGSVFCGACPRATFLLFFFLLRLIFFFLLQYILSPRAYAR